MREFHEGRDLGSGDGDALLGLGVAAGALSAVLGLERDTMNSRSRARMESRSSTACFRPGSRQTLFKSSLKVGVASIVLIDAVHE